MSSRFDLQLSYIGITTFIVFNFIARDTFKDVDRTATLKEFIKKKDEVRYVYRIITLSISKF